MAETTHSSRIHPGLERVPGKQNWIDKLPPGLKGRWHRSWIYRAAKHLHYDQGMNIGRAIAVAKNAAVKGCSTGDLNWPGKQSVNPVSRTEMCAAVATWKAMIAWTKTTNLANCSERELIELAYIPASTRKKSLKSGRAIEHKKAPGGGGYPINSKKDLMDAITLFRIHKAKYSPEKRARIAAHIRRWARHYGVSVNLSNSENESSSIDLAAGGSLPGKPFNPSKHLRGSGGRFINKGAGQANQAGQPTVVSFESAIRGLKRGHSIELPGGKGVVKKLGEGWQVRTGDGKFNKIFRNMSDAIITVGSIVRSRYGGNV